MIKDVYGDIWRALNKANAICITTNGYVKKNSEAVMGRGIASEALKKYPILDKILGKYLLKKGNHVHILKQVGKTYLVSFPVKPIVAPKEQILSRLKQTSIRVVGSNDLIPGWAAKADIKLIEQSAKELLELSESLNWRIVVLPRPGCGNGELDYYKEVRLVLSNYFEKSNVLFAITTKN